MNKYRSIMLLIIFAVLIIASCQSGEETADSVKSAQVVAIEAANPFITDIVITRTFSGTLEGARQSAIYATIPERVIGIPASEGQFVKSGDVLIKLDKNGVNSRFFQAQAVFQNAEDNYLKMEKLYKQDAISEMNFKSARTSYEVARADFIAAKATVELSSPIDGIVTDVNVNLGDQVPLHQPIATVASTGKMRLTVHVGLKETEKLKVGKAAEVMIEAQEPIIATIAEISKSADPETRLFRVELEMDNSNGILKPGMYAKAEIVVANFANVLAIANVSIFREEGITKVYTVENDSAFARTFEAGSTDGENTQVISGITQDELVVMVGKSSLRNATPVMITGGDN